MTWVKRLAKAPAQAAKGAAPLKAPEGDQDQALLSRDPVGKGRIGDLPAIYTGPRGEDGTGGQRGTPPASPIETRSQQSKISEEVSPPHRPKDIETPDANMPCASAA